LLPVSIFGVLYRIIDLRTKVFGQLWGEVDDNIKTRLLAIMAADQRLSPQDAHDLLLGQQLLDIFCKIADDDNSLKSRMLGIYLNGLLVTSVADLAIITFLAAVLHSVIRPITRITPHTY
jgi:hypothetical protein